MWLGLCPEKMAAPREEVGRELSIAKPSCWFFSKEVFSQWQEIAVEFWGGCYCLDSWSNLHTHDVFLLGSWQQLLHYNGRKDTCRDGEEWLKNKKHVFGEETAWLPEWCFSGLDSHPTIREQKDRLVIWRILCHEMVNHNWKLEQRALDVALSIQ